MSRTLVAIDPGKTGGIAVYHNGKVFVEDLESELYKLFYQLQRLKGLNYNIYFLVEDVGYHVKGNNAQHSATFARHCGNIESSLVSLSCNWSVVKPVVWMRKALPAGRPRVYAKRKAWIRNIMQKRFPELEVIKENADALGILLFLAQREEITLP